MLNERQDTILGRILAAGGDPEAKRATARELLQRFGSLEGIIRVPPEEMRRVESLAPGDLDLLDALRDMMMGIEDDRRNLDQVTPCPRALHAYVLDRYTCPQVGATSRAILFDRSLQLVGDVEVPQGIAPATAAQTLVQETLSRQAAAVIVVRLQANARVELYDGLRDTLQVIARALHLVGATLLQFAIATPTDLFPVSDLSIAPHAPN